MKDSQNRDLCLKIDSNPVLLSVDLLSLVEGFHGEAQLLDQAVGEGVQLLRSVQGDDARPSYSASMNL